jgi:hypothetical protein
VGEGVLGEFLVYLVDLVDEGDLQFFGAGNRFDEQDGGLLTELLALDASLLSAATLLSVLAWRLQTYDLALTHHLLLIYNQHPTIFLTRPRHAIPTFIKYSPYLKIARI